MAIHCKTKVRVGGTSNFAHTEECRFPTPPSLESKSNGKNHIGNCRTCRTALT